MTKIVAVIIFLLISAVSSASQEKAVELQLINGGYDDNYQEITLGLEVLMPKGWHSYWKSPGEGGLPPELDISGSNNIDTFEILWPTPHEINFNEVRTIGYEEKVIFPLIVKPKNPNIETNLKFNARVYACINYCTVFEKQFEISIPQGYSSFLRQHELSQWTNKVPLAQRDQLSLSNLVQVRPAQFTIDYSSASKTEPDVFIATKSNSPIEILSVLPNNKGGTIEFEVKQNTSPFPSEVEITLSIDNQSISNTFSISPISAPISVPIILAALAGGFILNLMPCVFPVLSLKLLSLTSGDEKVVRTSFAASSFGIVISFLFLGTTLSIMKLAGAQIGWGIQFQNPIFLGIMSLVILIFALSTAGYFNISIPSSISTKASLFTNGNGIFASIGQGFVATLLATPCSAPLVGTTIGFALSGSSIDIIAIFFAMGIGMSAPYLIISIAPGISKIIPKPGPWMNTVKTILAVLLSATAGWLAVLTASAVDINPLYICGVFLATFTLLQLKLHHVLIPTQIILVLAFLTPPLIDIINLNKNNENTALWRDFSPENISQLVENGDVVFIYATADWCITCKINERTTLKDDEVLKTLNEIHAMKADWTRPNDEISNFLKSNNRYGIPFSIVYSKTFPEGNILPEILTPSLLIEVINAEDNRF